MDLLDLDRVTCRLCITGDNATDKCSNIFTKTIKESANSLEHSQLFEEVSVNLLNMRLSEALESFTCIEVSNCIPWHSCLVTNFS